MTAFPPDSAQGNEVTLLLKSATKRARMAQRINELADDAFRRVALSKADYRQFFYRRLGTQSQREVIFQVAAKHERVRVLDAFAITAQQGCLYSFDGVHYHEVRWPPLLPRYALQFLPSAAPTVGWLTSPPPPPPYTLWQNTRARIGLELLGLALCEFHNQSLAAAIAALQAGGSAAAGGAAEST